MFVLNKEWECCVYDFANSVCCLLKCPAGNTEYSPRNASCFVLITFQIT